MFKELERVGTNFKNWMKTNTEKEKASQKKQS
jgi:hypothetical protein